MVTDVGAGCPSLKKQLASTLRVRARIFGLERAREWKTNSGPSEKIYASFCTRNL
jgi:hypothetical protein